MFLTRSSLSQVPASHFLPVFQEANNEVGAAGPSGDFEIREDRRNELGRGVLPVDPDLLGNTVEGGSSAAQLPQKNILERKEVLIGAYLLAGVASTNQARSADLASLLPPGICPCSFEGATPAAHVAWTHQDEQTRRFASSEQPTCLI